MMHSDNTLRCRFATALLVVATSHWTGAVEAQLAPERLPDAGEVVSAFFQAREWVNDYGTPRDDELAAGAIHIEGSRAACVVLRLNGQVLGEGIDQTGGDQMVRLAVRRALSQLHGSPEVSGIPVPMREQLGLRAIIEFEVAGEFVPLVGATFEEVGRRIRPGMDGFAMRAGDKWLVRFPAQLRATNNSADSASFLMRNVVSELGIRVQRSLAAYRQQSGLSVYRFSVVSLAQATSKESPFITVRGSRIASLGDSARATLTELAELIAARIVDLEFRDVPPDPNVLNPGQPVNPVIGLLGTYHPVVDRYRPLVASPGEQALMSYALSRFSKTPGVNPEAAGRAGAFAAEILADLAEVIPGQEADPLGEPASCAMIVLAAYEMRFAQPGPVTREMLVDARSRVWAGIDPASGAFRRVPGPGGQERELLSYEKAILAAAMARLALVAPVDGGLELARAALDAAWASAMDSQQVSLLPWIGWAEQDYGFVSGGLDPAGVERLEKLRSFLRESQQLVTPEDQPDLLGGFVLDGPRGPRNTAQGLRPGAWLARLLLDPQEVTDESLALELAPMLQFARFIGQLTVTSRESWAYSNPDRAIGGVRDSLWNSTQSGPAQALGLMTVCDIIGGIDRFESIR